jgi:hypothetical protein
MVKNQRIVQPLRGCFRLLYSKSPASSASQASLNTLGFRIFTPPGYKLRTLSASYINPSGVLTSKTR